jgi:NitT/TauT family transport system substrate-binding protein
MPHERKVRFVAFLLLVFSMVVGCRSKAPVTRLQREWTANAEFAGDVMAAQVSPQHGINLEVHEGSEVIDPVKEVRTSQADFGVASADRILRENEGGADLIILAASTYKSPVVFLTQPKAHIGSPKDFRDHTVGIQAGTNTEWVYKTLATREGLSPEHVKVVESGWGTTNFETGAIDVLAAFDYDEPVLLELKGGSVREDDSP